MKSFEALSKRFCRIQQIKLVFGKKKEALPLQDMGSQQIGRLQYGSERMFVGLGDITLVLIALERQVPRSHMPPDGENFVI